MRRLPRCHLTVMLAIGAALCFALGTVFLSYSRVSSRTHSFARDRVADKEVHRGLPLDLTETMNQSPSPTA
jgi:hypothetical protein